MDARTVESGFGNGHGHTAAFDEHQAGDGVVQRREISQNVFDGVGQNDGPLLALLLARWLALHEHFDVDGVVLQASTLGDIVLE